MREEWPKYKMFECEPGLRMAAQEKVYQAHHENLNKRLDRLEEMMERLERRLWLTVYGVVAVILAQAFESILVAAP